MKINTEINTNEANKAAVRRLYDECFNQGLFQAADDIIAPEFIVPGPGGGAGAEGFKANVLRLRAAFPDVHFTIHKIIAENEHVALCWTWEGTHSDVFANIPATGKHVHQEGMVLYRFENGQVAEAKLMFGLLGVFQQLGILPISSIAPLPSKASTT